MKRRLGIVAVVVGAALAAATAGRADPPVTAPNLVLISIDTTRADALSCYGRLPGLVGDGPRTPRLDALAAEGVRFERFYSHAPTTLVSHASMFTGQDPHVHGIPRNGFPLRGSPATLATTLGAAGYDTLAVVGAKALEQAMGLDVGFRVYDDHTPIRRGPMFQDTATHVVDRALAAADARDPNKPLFLFVHLYDPHAPYDPPPGFAEPFEPPGGPRFRTGEDAGSLGQLRRALMAGNADPAAVAHVAALYQGEVAYADAQIGRLLDGLGAAGLLDTSLVVVTADHGEVLSEAPEWAYTHGSDVTEGVMHVPLIVRGRGLPLASHTVVRAPVGMDGLASSVLAWLGRLERIGAPGFAELAGPGPVRDVSGWPDAPTRAVFQEATRPREQERTDAWNNLSFDRAVVAGAWRWDEQPRTGAPGALTPPAPGLGPVLDGMLARWDADAPPWRSESMSDDTTDALKALGYLDDKPKNP